MTPSHNQAEGNVASMAAAKSGDKELASICAAADHWRKWLKLERDRHTRVFQSTSPLSHVSARQGAAKTRSDSSPHSNRSPPRSSSLMQIGGLSCKLSSTDCDSSSTMPSPDPDNLLDRERLKWAATEANDSVQVLSTAPRPDPDNLLDRERLKWAAPICSPMRSPMRSPSSRQPWPSASSPGSKRSYVQCTQLFNDKVLISQSPPSR